MIIDNIKCPICSSLLDKQIINNYTYYECINTIPDHNPPSDAPPYVELHYQRRISPSGINIREIINLYPFSFSIMKSEKYSKLFRFVVSTVGNKSIYTNYEVIKINKQYTVDQHIVSRINTLINML